MKSSKEQPTNETEADLESQVVDWAEQQGGYAVKLKIENQQGFPDRTLLLPGAVIAFPELKSPSRRGRRRINQEKWVERLKRLGFAAAFCKSFEDVVQLVKDNERI